MDADVLDLSFHQWRTASGGDFRAPEGGAQAIKWST
jgi:hypothetical protein